MRPPEGDAAAELVEDGEHDPIVKAVGDRSAIAADGDVGVNHLLRREAERRQVPHERTAARRESQTVPLADGPAHMARGEVRPRPVVAAAHEHRVEELGGRFADLDEARALGPALPPLEIVVDLDAGTVRQIADRLGKGQVLALHDVGEAVAALTASEAVPDLRGGDDVKRGRLLAVERAAAPELLVARLKGNRLLHERYQVGGGAHALAIFVGNHRPSSTPLSPNCCRTSSMLPRTAAMRSSREANSCEARRRRSKAIAHASP